METENNQTQKKRSPFAFSKVVFVEYSYAKKGQHFMTVMTTVDRKKKIIGRIFKEYDQEAKKYNYKALDREGQPIFEPTQNLFELKKKFIENEKTRAMEAPANSVEKGVVEENPTREGELKEVRNSKKEKSQEIER